MSVEHIRLALEELGPTFMKLGQLLSTRADLLPPEYQAEFIKLQDAAPTLPREEIEKILVAELGQPVEDLFATFDFTPLAAASIGQAHAATLLDGTADPHPGNFFIEANGRIGLIDFSMVGTVDENTREALIRVLLAITSQDTGRLVDAFLDLGV